MLRGLRCGFEAVFLLVLRVRFPPVAWISVCSVFSDGGLCDEPITHPEESYRM